VLVHVVPDLLDLKVDLSSSSRFPNVDELFLLGSAPSLPVYAHGSPSLGVEQVWGASVTLGLRAPWIEFEASAFGQLIDDYIHFAPEFDDNGDPSFEVTIRGTSPSFGYRPLNAAFYGIDGELKLWPEGPVGLEVHGAVVRGREREGGDHLIGIPADQLVLALVGRPPDLGLFREGEVRVQVELNDRQRWVKPESDIAPSPPGYVLLGASVGASLDLPVPLRISIEGANLLNTSYRDYTSLLRYYADQTGWDVRLRISTHF
jgi:iron complex outermembrane receptor protein